MIIINTKVELKNLLDENRDLIIDDHLVINLNIEKSSKVNNIKAMNIDAWDIKTDNIKAQNVSYYGVCFANYSFKCKSIKGRRTNSKHFCLDSKIELTQD